MASSVPPASPPSTVEQMPAPSAAPPEAGTIQPPTPHPTITMPPSSSSPPLSPTPPPSNPVTPPPTTAVAPAPATVENSPPPPNVPSPPTISSVPPPVDTAPPPATTPAVENPPATLPPPPQTPPPKPSATPSPIPSPATTLPQPPVLNSTSPMGPTNSTWKPVGPGEGPAGPEVAPGPINWGTVGGGGHVSSGLIIGIGVAAVFVVLGLVLLYLCLAGRRRNEEEDKNITRKTDSSKNQESNHNDVEKGDPVIINFNLPKSRSQKHGKFEFNNNPLTPGAHHLPSSCKGSFSYEELVRATKGFSEANLIGEGGFGYVHKGMLPNGTEIAVKQLKTGSHQGKREFQAELDIISRVHHRHLVTLLGYCTSGAARFLVYEFVPNNTLEFHLHGEGQPIMDWATRMKIAIGAAKGLAYLHEDCCPSIIHRDIKAANILLDYNFQPKVSDFGLARFFSDTNNPITHISTRVAGTFGYLAPEYASSGRLTEKSDVYSFGVMLLELITGCPSIKQVDTLGNEALVDWARPLLRQAIETGAVDALVDPTLQTDYNPGEMESMITCAAACTRRAAWLRPRMGQIVHALERSEPLIDLYVETKPSRSKLYYSLEKKRLAMALASTVHCSSQRSDSTSEYGLNHSTSSGEA